MDYNGNTTIGGAASSTPALLVLGTKNTSGDPTCTNGAIYYNSSTNQSKICINSGWTAVGVPRVTTLPSSPSDGDEVYYVADSTNGVIWHLRYNSGSGSSYKWEFLGGSPLIAEVDTNETTTSATYVALTTAGPSITVPLAGDYMVGLGALVTNGTGNAAMSYDIGATGAVDADNVVGGESATLYNNVFREKRKTGFAANTTLTAKYRSTTGTSFFQIRWMRIIPVRVGP